MVGQRFSRERCSRQAGGRRLVRSVLSRRVRQCQNEKRHAKIFREWSSRLPTITRTRDAKQFEDTLPPPEDARDAPLKIGFARCAYYDCCAYLLQFWLRPHSTRSGLKPGTTC